MSAILLKALQILTLISTSLPTVIKILGLITEASKKYTESTDKHAFVMAELTKVLPKLNEDERYNWLKSVLYLARLIGLKV